jgi:hypothetical protein
MENVECESDGGDHGGDYTGNWWSLGAENEQVADNGKSQAQ